MIRYDRQQKILEYLEKKQSATVKELSDILFSSEASIRRDVETLEGQGYVKKIYGGVILSKYQNGVIPVNLRACKASRRADKGRRHGHNGRIKHCSPYNKAYRTSSRRQNYNKQSPYIFGMRQYRRKALLHRRYVFNS